MKLYPIKKLSSAFFLITIIASCGKEKLQVLNSTYQPTNPTTVQASFPPVSGPARVFNFLSQSSYEVRGYTTRSRYVIYDTGAFGLQYSDNGGFEYRGRYKQENNALVFEWEGWSIAGPWGATGTLRGDTLTIAYNTIMEMSDFENAVYLRQEY